MKRTYIFFWLFSLLSLAVHNKIAHAETLTAATLHFPPYSYEGEKEVEGISVNIVRTAAERLGIDLDVRVYPWARALNLVKNGKVDMLFTAYWTAERQQFLDYSSVPLIVQKVSLFTHKNSGLKTIDNVLARGSVPTATRRKVSYGSHVDNFLDQGILKTSFVGNDDAQILYMLKEERIDIVPMSQFVGYENIHHLGIEEDIREITLPVSTVPSFLTFSKMLKHKEHVDAFSSELKRMNQDGSIQAILDNWLSKHALSTN